MKVLKNGKLNDFAPQSIKKENQKLVKGGKDGDINWVDIIIT